MKNIIIAIFMASAVAVVIDAKQYVFKSERTNPIVVKLVLRNGTEVKTGSAALVKIDKQIVNIPDNAFVEQLIVTEFKPEGTISETWHSRQTGKGENVGPDFIKYYGHDELLNRGGEYKIKPGSIE